MIDADGELVHLGFPIRRGSDGKLVTVEQGSPDHVMAQVNTVVRYPFGYRLEYPSFGIPWPAFANAPVNADTIAASVALLVPDAVDVNYSEYADSVDASIRNVELHVEIPNQGA